jgi:hypothetical protein
MAWDKDREFLFFWLMVQCIIWKDYFDGLHSRPFNFDKFKSEGLHEKHAETTWNHLSL